MGRYRTDRRVKARICASFFLLPVLEKAASSPFSLLKFPLSEADIRRKMAGFNLVLSNLLPIDAVKLGWLVTSIHDPSQDYFQPDGAFINSAEISVQQLLDFQQTVEESNDRNFTATLTALLSAGRVRQSSTKASVASSICTIHQLQNSSEYLQRVCAARASRAFLERAVRRSQDLFLVTGTKTVVDSTVSNEVSNGVSVQGRAQAPLTLGATAFGIPMPIDGMLDVGMEGNRSRAEMSGVSYTAPGEQIFAVQYRKLRFARFSRAKIDDAKLEEGNRWKMYVGGRGEDEQDQMDQYVGVELGELLPDDILDEDEGGSVQFLGERFVY